MNDHLHVLFRPNESEFISKSLHSWKPYTGNRLQRQFGRDGRVWQEEHYDRIIRNEREFYDTARYVLDNPKKRWRIEQYKWMNFKSPED